MLDVGSFLFSTSIHSVMALACIAGPLSSAAAGLVYATRSFRCVALVEWAGLILYVPAVSYVAKSDHRNSLAWIRSAYMVPAIVRFLGYSVAVVWQRRGGLGLGSGAGRGGAGDESARQPAAAVRVRRS